ncbi:hypothetical protein [Microtetraspora glauca]|uniref:DUF222 domain-containing protein n=1 Tax=Microtetraspora glauca TaxID=1996 RepID=A0ABV3G827_MICGL
MTAAPPWKPGTGAAERRDEAVRRILAGEPTEIVRKELKLDTYDSRVIADHVRTLTADTRRAAALARLRSGEMNDSVRSDLRLGPGDVEVVASQLRETHPWLAAIMFGDDDWQDCPGVSPHPASPQAGRVALS